MFILLNLKTTTATTTETKKQNFKFETALKISDFLEFFFVDVS